jgi:glycosyltransferase involved in cell wall biosynthesis
MKLSVIVTTLNGRERLRSCLDALSDHVPPTTEIVVVNGPSSDGTTGAVRERDDVDVLVEISDRNRNSSRNAGIEVASGDVVAFVGDGYHVDSTWFDAVDAAFSSGADVVTGPVRGVRSDVDSKRPQTVAGRSVTHFDGDNVAFDRTVLDALDGFDESLSVGGARDCAHRLAAMGFTVTWNAGLSARADVGTDGGRAASDWGAVYRSLAYRLAKNYGLRPGVIARTAGNAVMDALAGVRAIVAGDVTPSDWYGNEITMVRSAAVGLADGLRARYSDRSSRRNPSGVSARHDRAVRIYDRR